MSTPSSLNYSMLNTLVEVGVVDGLLIAFVIAFYVFNKISANKRAALTPPTPSREVAPSAASVPEASAVVKKQHVLKTVVPKPAQVTPSTTSAAAKPDTDMVLKGLIDTARKHTDKCSMCAAYVSFYDKNTFISGGMTAVGVLTHIESAHKS